MHVFHFGEAATRLFGVYHPPSNQASSQARGVIICQPFGHEYIRSHRALRTLARRLSDAGCHTLRFDYFGTGDSMGSGDETTLAQCTTDIKTAIDELKDMAGVVKVSVVGVRLGATLAAIAASARKDVDKLVLWDPVVLGIDYLEGLQALQIAWLKERPYMSHKDPEEIIGFPLRGALRSEIASLDLRSLSKWPGKQTLVFASAGVDCGSLGEHLERQRAQATIDNVEGSCDWDRPSQVHKALIAPELTQRVLASLEGKVTA